MKRRFIALALAGGLMPAAVMADMEIYGQANASLEFLDDGSVAGGAMGSQVLDNDSRLGFRGMDGLGSGPRGIWQYETGFDVSSGEFANIQRNTFAGITGAYGTLFLGHHDSPYKWSSDKLDPFVDSSADYHNLMGSGVSIQLLKSDLDALAVSADGNADTGDDFASIDAGDTDGRVEEVIAFKKDFNQGTSLFVAYGVDHSDDQFDDDTLSINITYDLDPLYLGVGYIDTNAGATLFVDGAKYDGLDITGHRLALAYTLKQTTTYALVYESLEAELQKAGTTQLEESNAYFSIAHRLGDNTLKLAYGIKQSDSAGAPGKDATFNAVGMERAYNEFTSVYIHYASMDNDAGAAYGLDMAGLNGVAGDKVNTTAFGIKTRF
ncbi:MAG: porin [Gammaproteobacteria bacterium]|nr:porin [Gammaproteobacteria bacterium]